MSGEYKVMEPCLQKHGFEFYHVKGQSLGLSRKKKINESLQRENLSALLDKANGSHDFTHFSGVPYFSPPSSLTYYASDSIEIPETEFTFYWERRAGEFKDVIDYNFVLCDHKEGFSRKQRYREHANMCFPECATQEDVVAVYQQRLEALLSLPYKTLDCFISVEDELRLRYFFKKDASLFIPFAINEFLPKPVFAVLVSRPKQFMMPTLLPERPSFRQKLIKFFHTHPPAFWHDTPVFRLHEAALMPYELLQQKGHIGAMDEAFQFRHRGLNREKYVFFSAYFGVVLPTDPSPLLSKISLRIKDEYVDKVLKQSALFFPFRDRVVEVSKHWGTIQVGECEVMMHSFASPIKGKLGSVCYTIHLGGHHEFVHEDNRQLIEDIRCFPEWMTSRVEPIMIAIWSCYAKAYDVLRANEALSTYYDVALKKITEQLMPPMMVCVNKQVKLKYLSAHYFVRSGLMNRALSVGLNSQVDAQRAFYQKLPLEALMVHNMANTYTEMIKGAILSQNHDELIRLGVVPPFKHLTTYHGPSAVKPIIELRPQDLYFYLPEIEAWGNALHFAVLQGDTTMARRVLEEFKLNPNACVESNHQFVYLYGHHNGPTAISYALTNLKMRQLLTHYGANPFHECCVLSVSSYAITDQLHRLDADERDLFFTSHDPVYIKACEWMKKGLKGQLTLEDALRQFHHLDRLICAFGEFRMLTQLVTNENGDLCLYVHCESPGCAGSATLHPFQHARLLSIVGIKATATSMLFNGEQAAEAVKKILSSMLTCLAIDALNDRCETEFFVNKAWENRYGGAAVDKKMPPTLCLPGEITTYDVLMDRTRETRSFYYEMHVDDIKGDIVTLGLDTYAGKHNLDKSGEHVIEATFHSQCYDDMLANFKRLGFHAVHRLDKLYLHADALMIADQYANKNPLYRGEFDVFLGSQVALSDYSLRQDKPKLTTSGGHFNRPGGDPGVDHREDEEFSPMPSAQDGGYPVVTVRLGDNKSELLFRMHLQLNLPLCQPDLYEYADGKVRFQSICDIPVGTELRAFFHNAKLVSPFQYVFEYISSELSRLTGRRLECVYDVLPDPVAGHHKTQENFAKIRDLQTSELIDVDPLLWFTLLKYPDYFADVRQHLLDQVFGLETTDLAELYASDSLSSRVCFDNFDKLDQSSMPCYLALLGSADELRLLAEPENQQDLKQLCFVKHLQAHLKHIRKVPTQKCRLLLGFPMSKGDDLYYDPEQKLLWEAVKYPGLNLNRIYMIRYASMLCDYIGVKAVPYDIQEEAGEFFLWRKMSSHLTLEPEDFEIKCSLRGPKSNFEHSIEMDFVPTMSDDSGAFVISPVMREAASEEQEAKEEEGEASVQQSVINPFDEIMPSDHWIFQGPTFLLNWLIGNFPMKMAQDEVTHDRFVSELNLQFDQPMKPFMTYKWTESQLVTFKLIFVACISSKVTSFFEWYESKSASHFLAEFMLPRIKELEEALSLPAQLSEDIELLLSKKQIALPFREALLEPRVDVQIDELNSP